MTELHSVEGAGSPPVAVSGLLDKSGHEETHNTPNKTE